MRKKSLIFFPFHELFQVVCSAIRLRLSFWYIRHQLLKLPLANHLFQKIVQKRLEKCRIVHLMFNDKFNQPFTEFLNQCFPDENHLILCKRIFPDFPGISFPHGKNVFEISKFCDFQFPLGKKYIFHSLFDAEMVSVLTKNPKLLACSYWMVWGGDLYEYPQDKYGSLCYHFHGYITDVDGDDALIQSKYGKNAHIIHAGYTFPITRQMIAYAQEKKHLVHKRRLQINNSCDYSTLEIMDIMASHYKKDPSFEVVTVCSYGQTQWKSEICARGKALFGNDFYSLDELLSPSEYTHFLAQSDVLILNQNRQQGLGNSFAALALGMKVFIRKEVSTYDFFLSHGIHIFDTTLLNSYSLQDIFYLDPKYRREQQIISQRFFSNEYLKELWSQVFNDDEQ